MIADLEARARRGDFPFQPYFPGVEIHRIYGEDKAYRHTVFRYMDELRTGDEFETLTFDQADGLTLVKRTPSGVST